jgi:dihydrofolate synthase/folylpolyglutamate synthase
VKRDDPIARLFALEQFGIKLGLDNIRALVAALDHPERSFATIHIAGTNGKGSVSAMVERGLRAAGHRTGRYTSPHLDRIEERVAIDGEPVASRIFHAVASHVLSVIDRLHGPGTLATTPTFFEVTTAMAFEIFRRAKVKVAVIEVGLGGRFDATNVITPAVAAITSIAFDHERHLGNTLASIAHEKAGILKPGVPTVIGELPEEAQRAIEEAAKQQRTPLVFADSSLVTAVEFERGRAIASVTTPIRSYPRLRLALNGAHQVANAVVAIRVLELLDKTGIHVGGRDIATGVTGAVWPARLEWLRLQEGSRLLVDAAHNPAGAAALADYLHASHQAPLPIVLAVMKDKDVESIIRALRPVASLFVATAAASPRALPARELAEIIRRVDPGKSVEHVNDSAGAVRLALTTASSAVAAGSIFLVGPLRSQLLADGAVSLADQCS